MTPDQQAAIREAVARAIARYYNRIERGVDDDAGWDLGVAADAMKAHVRALEAAGYVIVPKKIEPEIVIEEIVRSNLPSEIVESVAVHRDEIDGSLVWRIAIALNRPLQSVENRHKMIGLARHILAALEDGDRYPVIEFLSIGDAKKRAALRS